MPSNWLAFDRIRALTRQYRIYQAERVYQDQPHLDRLTAGGDFLDMNQQAAILDQTNLQINRLERYKDYEQMDQTGEISLALDLYADETSLVDPERKHTLIIRARNRRLKHELEDLFFNTLRWDTYCRPSVRYLCKYGDAPFEVILDANRSGVTALKFMNVYNFTRIETRFGDLVGFFYMDAIWPKPLFLHPWQVMHMRLTSFENIYHPYGRCCDLDSYVDTPIGHKKLRHVQVGDYVMSWNGHAASPTRVLATASSGIKETLTIRTKHREVRLTPEHPVLAVVKDNYIDTKFGPKRDTSTKQWVLAKDLKEGDKLVLPRYDRPGTVCEGQQIQLLADKSVTEATNVGHRLSFPEYVDVDFARLMGFLIGDGWTSTNERILYFAEGEHHDINRKYIDIIREYGYDREPGYNAGENSQYGNFQFSSTELARTVIAMGLVGRCWEKRIPEWVFVAKPEVQLAFIEGLVDSDGSVNIDKWDCERFQFESASEELCRDLKHLLDRMGYKCGNVGKRNRRDKTVIHGKIYDRRDSWVVYWYDSKLPTGDIEHRGRRWTRYKHNSPTHLLETILEIVDGGAVEVGDIQVENHANFVCGGVVVHNSILDGGRKAFKQLRLMEDAALIYRITRAPEKRKFTIPVGMIPPKEVPEYMQMIARNFKRQRFYNPTTGTFDERYSPLIQEDDFFMPRRPDGTGPDVDVLPGAENLDQIKDIEYFKKKMIAPLKIPFARVGIGDGAGEASEKSLSQSHAEFSKAVQWIQREIATGLTKVAIIHLALRGYRIEDLRGFEIALTATSAMEELYRIETWQTRVAVMADLKELGWFPKEWIVTHFTDLTPDEIQELKDMEQLATDVSTEEGEGSAGGAGLGGGASVGGGALGGLETPEEGVDVDDVLGGAAKTADEEETIPAEEESQIPLEGLDHRAAGRLIREMRKDKSISEMKSIIEGWGNRLGKGSKRSIEFSSGFDHMLTMKELDGLSQSPPSGNNTILEGVHNPNEDDNLLVEWSVDETARYEAIKEVYDVLVDSREPVLEDEQAEITPSDLPVNKDDEL